MNADGTKIKKILRAGSKIGARAIEKQIINLLQPYMEATREFSPVFGLLSNAAEKRYVEKLDMTTENAKDLY